MNQLISTTEKISVWIFLRGTVMYSITLHIWEFLLRSIIHQYDVRIPYQVLYSKNWFLSYDTVPVHVAVLYQAFVTRQPIKIPPKPDRN